MTSFDLEPRPDFHAIHRAHLAAVAGGYVDPSQLPPGTVSLEAAYAQVDADEALSGVLSLDVVEPALTTAGLSRRCNGFDGSSKTVKQAPPSHANTSVPPSHEASEAMSSFSRSVREELEEASDFESWRSHQYFETDVDEALVLTRWQEHLDRKWDEIHTDAAQRKARQRAVSLQSTRYGKGFGVKLTAEEASRAAEDLARDSARNKGGEPKPPKATWAQRNPTSVRPF